MTDVREGTRVDYAMAGLPLKFEAYAHEGGVICIYDPATCRHVDLNVIGMTDAEIERATRVAATLLEAEPDALNG